MTDRVTIAGGGASGMLLARALLEASPDVSVRVYEPHALGPGLAHGTQCPLHLLNVPAGKISAFANAPEHFTEYLAARHPFRFGPTSFVPRTIYGAYLQSIAEDTASRYPGRLQHIRARLERDSGDEILVLATGNERPAPLPTLSGALRVFDDPWDAQISQIGRHAGVTIVGSGLTAIDALFALRARGDEGRVRFVSRNGRLPHQHRDDTGGDDVTIDRTSLRSIVGSIRAAGREWRSAIDGLRPHANDLWQSFSQRERERFMRFLAPMWNVHRHRMAPEIALMLADERANGTLEIVSQSIRKAAAGGLFDGEIVINATGPNVDLARTSNALLRSLYDAGELQSGPFGMGVTIDEHGATIDARGNVSSRIYAMGPLRAGSTFETIAMPEIRQQAVDLATRLVARKAIEAA